MGHDSDSLWEWRCPECGSQDAFAIIGAVSNIDIRLSSDGTDETDQNSLDWDRSNKCSCSECGHEGVVANFDG